MHFTQLNPPIPMECPKGKGYAIGVIDYSQEHHLMWVIALDSNGEIWTCANPDVRLQNNISMGRIKPRTMEDDGVSLKPLVQGQYRRDLCL